MKPELSERLLIEELFLYSVNKMQMQDHQIKSIERLTGDASTRRYYRVFCENISYVVCLDNPAEKNEDNSFLRVQSFLSENEIRVPQIFHTNISKGYILEEDLGDTTLLNHLASINSEEVEFDLYRKVIDEIIKLHKLEKNEIEKSEIFDTKFDFEKLQFEIDFTGKYFLEYFLGVKDESLKQKVAHYFEPINRRLSSYEMVLTHRDFHSRNVMVMGEELVMIDFQDARWGIPQYDLASLLDDCYYDVSRNNRYKLLQYYYDHVPKEIHQFNSFQAFHEAYIEMALQRVFKAVGSFAYIYHNRQDERYVKYIGFAMEKLRNYMLKDSKYNDLRKTLFGIYYAS